MPNALNSPGCQLLIIVPTPMERGILEKRLLSHEALRGAKQSGKHRWIVCGVGPVISGITTSRAIAELRPAKVLLLGIAGSLADRLEVSSVFLANRFLLEGVGAYRDERIESFDELPFQMYEPADSLDPDWSLESPISFAPWLQPLDQSSIAHEQTPWSTGSSLTVCAASGSASQARQRSTLANELLAEEMEGFSVAAASRCHGLPFAMVRGISNRAGDRRKAHWQIGPALEAVADALVPPLLATLDAR